MVTEVAPSNLGNDKENKWQRDIGDRCRQNLIKDVVSVVVTVVIVNTANPLPHKYQRTTDGKQKLQNPNTNIRKQKGYRS